MSFNYIQSPGRDQDDEQSRRWSTKTVASTSLNNGWTEETTDPPTSSEGRLITAETLSWLPRGHSALNAHMNSRQDEHFHERQADHAQGWNHLNTKHAAAMTLSFQRYCDVIARHPAEVDVQAEMLSGLELHMKPNPTPGVPAHLHDELGPTPPPQSSAASILDPDDQDDDNAFYASLEDAYATAYQMQPSQGTPLGSILAETMRREAALDDAIFRPSLCQTMTRTVPMESQRAWGDPRPVIVHRSIRQRKKGGKGPE